MLLALLRCISWLVPTVISCTCWRHGRRQALAEWFSVGLLQLRRITYGGCSAELLERIMRYEAVHPMAGGWPELKRRLSSADRRVYAFFHPCMPEVCKALHLSPVCTLWVVQLNGSCYG